MFRTHSFVYLALLALLVLTQCTSAPDEQQTEPQYGSDVTQQELSLTEEKTASDWLDVARKADNEVAQHSALIRAANAFQNEQKWQQSAAILSQLSSQKITRHSQKYFRLAQARWATEQQQWEQVIEALQGVPEQFNKREFRALALRLLSRAAYQQQDYWQSLVWQVDAARFSDAISAQTIWSIAQHIRASGLPSQRPANVTLAGWWRLVDYHHNAMDAPDALADDLQQWQHSYSGHAANPLVETWRNTGPEDDKASKKDSVIAVLLPLSGRYAQQGQAVRDGIIARISDAGHRHTVFIDTQQYDVPTQQDKVQALAPTGIIGPLLKDTVKAWAEQPLPSIPQVFLNHTDNALMDSSSDVFFALRPDTEARDAAHKIQQASDDEQKALVIAANTSSSKRMVDAFTRRWGQDTDQAPHVVYFSDRSDMKATVESALGVTASQQRIRAVKIAAGKIIVDEQERSRNDISAIYLPGNAQQTRLLKPFIDVSVSPFAHPIPVYASSATHELKNRQGDPDLKGITFSDVPWLVENDYKNQLLEQWLTSRNGWGLSLARLVAMGYDSVALIKRMTIMQRAPGLRWHGLSGVLHIDQASVQRDLKWATFNKDNVTLVKDPNDAGSRNR